jgi:hypothetical protein
MEINITDWGPASISFTCRNNAVLRGASKRNLVFADMNFSNGYGLEEHKRTMSWTLFIVMCKGGLHEDIFTVDKHVACWGHCQLKLCSVFFSLE